MTTKKQGILLERLETYCKQLGVEIIPRIIWTKKEVKELPAVSVGSGHASKNTLGYCYYRDNLIYIAYSKHSGLVSLDETLRHELIRYRFPKMNHGKTFAKKIKELKNGVTWEPFNRALFVEKKILEWVEYRFRQFLRGVNHD